MIVAHPALFITFVFTYVAFFFFFFFLFFFLISATFDVLGGLRFMILHYLAILIL